MHPSLSEVDLARASAVVQVLPLLLAVRDRCGEQYGVMRGVVLAGWRVLRCNPFSHGGYDPVERQDSSSSGAAEGSFGLAAWAIGP